MSNNKAFFEKMELKEKEISDKEEAL